MSDLNKMASACASVAKAKLATNWKAIDAAMETGDAARKAVRDLNKARASLSGGTPDWLKVLLGIGGGSVAVKTMQDNQNDWRR